MKIYGDGEAYELLLPEFDLTNVCFYYIPKRLRGVAKNKEFYDELDKVMSAIQFNLYTNIFQKSKILILIHIPIFTDCSGTVHNLM